MKYVPLSAIRFQILWHEVNVAKGHHLRMPNRRQVNVRCEAATPLPGRPQGYAPTIHERACQATG